MREIRTQFARAINVIALARSTVIILLIDVLFFQKHIYLKFLKYLCIVLDMILVQF